MLQLKSSIKRRYFASLRLITLLKKSGIIKYTSTNQLYMLHMPSLNQTKPDTSSLQRHYVMVTTMLEKSLVLYGGMAHCSNRSPELQTRIPFQKVGFSIMNTFYSYFITLNFAVIKSYLKEILNKQIHVTAYN